MFDPQVLEFIEETMSKVKDQWARGIQYEMGVCCLACKEMVQEGASAERQLHLIALEECYSKQEIYCEYEDKVVPTQLYWDQIQPAKNS